MFFNDNFKLAAAAALLSIAVMGYTSPESCAQQYMKPTGPIKKENVDQTDALSQKFTINGLPEYSGKQKFLAGRKYVSESGPQYMQEFLVMEPASQVIDWYKDALGSYKWKITSSANNFIQAKRSDGSSVMIVASPFKSKEGRSRVKISYHDYR